MLDKFICMIVLVLVIVILWLDKQRKAKGQRITGRAWQGSADNIEREKKEGKNYANI